MAPFLFLVPIPSLHYGCHDRGDDGYVRGGGVCVESDWEPLSILYRTTRGLQ